MDWYLGYTAGYSARYVDANTWRDLDHLEITGGSINKGSDNLMESAELSATDYDQTKERWVRIYLDAMQNGVVEHQALFTGLATSPQRTIDGMIENEDIDLYSVLKPAEDILLQRGWYAPSGMEGAGLIKELLEVTPAPVTVQGTSPKLNSSIVAEDGETNLSMMWKILNAINWRIVINGRGEIILKPQATTATVMLDQTYHMAIEPQVSVAKDWFGCPNVYRAVADDIVATAEDTSGGFLSISGRGRRVETEELNAVTGDNESLEDYAKRKLEEAQRVQEVASYSRRYLPDVYVGDIINYHYDVINGDYMVTSQRISLDFNATTAEEVMRYVGD